MTDILHLFTPQVWMKQALCVGMPTRHFFPELGDRKEQIDNLKAAKQMCLRCPVKGQCLAYGKETRSAGLWGGVVLRGKGA